MKVTHLSTIIPDENTAPRIGLTHGFDDDVLGVLWKFRVWLL